MGKRRWEIQTLWLLVGWLQWRHVNRVQRQARGIPGGPPVRLPPRLYPFTAAACSS